MDMDFEKAKDKALLFIYWSNKLEEGGFVHGGPKITTAGFDRAMDLIEEGVLLDEEFLEACCKIYKTDETIIPLIMEIQDIGLQGMLDLLKKIEDEKRK